jgi:uncharacterized protein YaiI (UPF0178 family)
MQIWVDADACPNVVKDILYRAADKRHVMMTLVANQWLKVPISPYIRTLQVPSGFDVADNKIAQEVVPGDLVITADIPLAAQVVAKGAYALNHRGQFYTKDNIQEQLALRDFLSELRSGGVVTTGPSPINQADRQAFANQLDRFITQHGNA